jgi:hypothetical protein
VNQHVYIIFDKSKGRIAQIVRGSSFPENVNADLSFLRKNLKPDYTVTAVPVSSYVGPHFLKESLQ